MRFSIIILLAIAFCLPLKAQKAGYKIDRTTYDFGDVQVWSNQPAHFSITNTGKQNLLFLPTFPKDDIFVELPEGSIQPGVTATISIYYFTNGTGEFKRKVDLYTNTSKEAIKLTIKGNILSLDPQAYIQCPGFAPKQQSDKTFQQEVIIVDKKTQQPIDEATVWLNTEGNELKLLTKDNGKAKENILTGLYNIMVEKEGYETASQTIYLNKQTGKMVITLEPQTIPDLVAELNDETMERKELEEDPLLTFDSYERTEYDERIETLPTTPDEASEEVITEDIKETYKPEPEEPVEESVHMEEAAIQPEQKEEEPSITFETYERTGYEERIDALTTEYDDEEFVALEDSEIRDPEEYEPAVTDDPKEIQEPTTTEPLEDKEVTSFNSEPIIENEVTPKLEVLPPGQYNANNIVFLIDVSSSMRKPEKLPLLKTSMKHLTDVLRDIDRISVITYSSKADVVLSSTTVDNKEEISTLIDSLKAEGWTHGVKGIETAYDMIEANFITGGNNQIILATDGIFNNPSYSERELFSLVRDKTSEDIKLSVIGFGDDNDALRLMKKLASRGNGSFLQIENRFMANNLLIDEIKLHSMRAY